MDRVDPEPLADQLRSLEQFLDFHRATLLQKAAGLEKAQLATPLPPTRLTLGGLLKHAALNEDHWFQQVLLGRDLPEPWAGAPFDDDPDWELHSAADDEPDDLRRLHEAACERSRAAVREVGDLLHMLEESARHNGHADLLRQNVDGATGE